jgi:hypothetical protein
LLISGSFQSMLSYSRSTMERIKAALTLDSSKSLWNALEEMALNWGARTPSIELMIAVL